MVFHGIAWYCIVSDCPTVKAIIFSLICEVFALFWKGDVRRRLHAIKKSLGQVISIALPISYIGWTNLFN